MSVLTNMNELNEIREKALANIRDREENKTTIILGMGTCGIAAGANRVAEEVWVELDKHNIAADVINVGCIGMCHNEPLLDIQQPGLPRTQQGRKNNRKTSSAGKIYQTLDLWAAFHGERQTYRRNS